MGATRGKTLRYSVLMMGLAVGSRPPHHIDGEFLAMADSGANDTEPVQEVAIGNQEGRFLWSGSSSSLVTYQLNPCVAIIGICNTELYNKPAKYYFLIHADRGGDGK